MENGNDIKQNEVVVFKPSDKDVGFEVILDSELNTVFLSQKSIAELFDVQRPAITKYLLNIFDSFELKEEEVSSILEHTTKHGAIKDKLQHIKIKY